MLTPAHTATYWLSTSLRATDHPLWAQLVSQFPVQLQACSSSPCFISGSEGRMGDSAKSLADVQVDNAHCSLLTYQTSQLLLIIFLWFVSLEIVSMISCSITIMGI